MRLEGPAVAEVGDPAAAELLLQPQADRVRRLLGRAAQHEVRRRARSARTASRGRPRPPTEGVGKEDGALDPLLQPGGQALHRGRPRAADGGGARESPGGDTEDFAAAATARNRLRGDDQDAKAGAAKKILGDQDPRHAAGNLRAIMDGDDDRKGFAPSRPRVRRPGFGSIRAHENADHPPPGVALAV